MPSPNSIDELFLKAAELDGAQRRKFLRTLPADVRAQVEKLLAADESIEGRGFLSQPIHRQSEQKKPDSAGRSKGPRSQTSQPRKKSTALGPVSNRPSKTTSKRSGKAKQTGTQKRLKTSPTLVSPTKLLGAIAGVVVSVVLVFMIAAVIRNRLQQPNEEEIRDTTIANADSIRESKTESKDLPLIVAAQSTTQDPAPPEQFYSAAINAPPLSDRELQTLPKSLHDAAPVANPLPLPGVRAWSIETVGPRGRSTGLALTKDGRIAAVGGGDGCIRIVDVGTGQFVKLIVLANFESKISSLGHIEQLHWRREETGLLVCHNNRLLNVDTELGSTVEILDGIGRFCVTSDGESVYVPRREKLHVINTRDLSAVEEIPIGPVWRVSLSEKSRYFLISHDKSMALYENVRPPRLIMEDTRTVGCGIHVVNDDGIAVVGWRDGMIRVYDHRATTNAPVSEFQAYGEHREAGCQAWLDDDNVLCSGWGMTLDQYSISQNLFVKRQQVPLFGPPLIYRKDLKAGLMGSSALWHIKDGNPEKLLLQGDEQNRDSLTFNRDGTELLLSGNDASRFDLRNGLRSSLSGTQERLNLFNLEMNRNGLLAGKMHDGVRVFRTAPPTINSSVHHNFAARRNGDPNYESRHVVWAEGGRSVLVRSNDGQVYHWRVDADDQLPIPLTVPGGEILLDVVWDASTWAAYLLSESGLFKWSPATGLVDEICDVPEGSRAISVNGAGTYMSIVAPKATLIETTGFTTIAEFSWHSGHHFWAADDELLCLSDGGRTMYKVNPAVPGDARKVPIPLKGFGFGGHRAFAISPTAPVAAAITQSGYHFIDIRNGAHLGTLLLFRDDHALLTPEGRIVGMSPGMGQQIVYQILTDQGQETLTSAEFFRRFGEYLTQ